jgi:signal transduction histidine kinase
MKVLVADDDLVSRRLLQSFLQKAGHEVVIAADGAEAWRLFEQGDFPLVISDWEMPEIDGLELIRRIRSCVRPGYVYAILVTAKSAKEDLIEAMEAGADEFLSKPFAADEFRVRLREGERILHLERTLAEQNQALREAQAAMLQTEKLASLGQLAAGMAHEINNPIAFASNNLAVMRRDVFAALDVLNKYRAGQTAEAAQLEEEIDLAFVQESLPRLFDDTRAGLRRVRDVVANLRDFARVDEADLKEADLNAAIRATAEVLRHEFHKKQVLLEMYFGDLPLVLCRPGKINQVFLNVLLNAVQACSAGGTVGVSTSAPADGLVEVEVRDDGCGIRPEHMPRIFEPFFTTKPVGQGTGLGLSVSYGIVRDHGGTIEAESTPGHGTVFRIRLPQRPPPR